MVFVLRLLYQQRSVIGVFSVLDREDNQRIADPTRQEEFSQQDHVRRTVLDVIKLIH